MLSEAGRAFPPWKNHCKVQTTLPALREQGFRFEEKTGFPFTNSIQDTKGLTGRTSSAAAAADCTPVITGLTLHH